MRFLSEEKNVNLLMGNVNAILRVYAHFPSRVVCGCTQIIMRVYKLHLFYSDGLIAPENIRRAAEMLGDSGNYYCMLVNMSIWKVYSVQSFYFFARKTVIVPVMLSLSFHLYVCFLLFSEE